MVGWILNNPLHLINEIIFTKQYYFKKYFRLESCGEEGKLKYALAVVCFSKLTTKFVLYLKEREKGAHIKGEPVNCKG